MLRRLDKKAGGQRPGIAGAVTVGAAAGADSAEKNYQAQYDYYRAGNSKVHYKHNATGTAASVWCRSVYSSNGGYFCLVSADGSANRYHAINPWALAPCFFV